MKFTRRNHGLFSAAGLSGQRPRPSRACRPTLGMELCEKRTLLSITLVSTNAMGTASANSDSDFVSTSSDDAVPYYAPTQANPGSLSADGTKLVFVSDATDVAGSVSTTTPDSNVFVQNTATGQTSLVSVTADGQPANGDSFDPMISPNGEYVAFLSMATNLTAVAGQMSVFPAAPAVAALYVRDLETQTTTLLDETPSGQASDGLSTAQFVFSPDSTSLAWVDTSDNLTIAPLDPLSRPTNSGELPAYVYVRDLAAQTTSLVSASTTGEASGNVPETDFTADLVFSPDSQSLVFGSTATDLTTNLPTVSPSPPIASGAPNPENLFLYNFAAGTTTLLTVTTSGLLDVEADSSGAVFSPDGNAVAFTSTATDLTANAADPTSPAGANAQDDPPSNVYLRDLTTGATTLVSATPEGMMSDGIADTPVFSPDGGSLAYSSSATDLTNNAPDPTPPPDSSLPIYSGPSNVFLTNLSTGVTTLVSATPNGMLSNGLGSLTTSDNGDLMAAAGWGSPESPGTPIVFSPNGDYLAYTTDATDLTTNLFETAPPSLPGTFSNQGAFSNVFITNLETGTTTLASVTTNGQIPNTGAGNLIFSADSGSLFFTSNAIDLTSNPPDTSASSQPGLGFGGTNLFDYDLSAGTTSLISATPSGQLSNSSSMIALLSPDGQTLYFDSNAPDMTASDSNSNLSTEIFAASAPFTVANQIQFQSWETAVTESSGQVVITVLRSGPATAAASVDYSVQSGTAQAGVDFTATSGTLDFAAGQMSQTFTVPLTASDEFNGTRSAELVLSNPQGASLGYPSAVLDLTANPPPAGTPVATPVSTPKATSPTPSAVAANSAPTITGVADVKGRKGITKLVITFNQALAPAAAANVASYSVSVSGHRHGKHRTAVVARAAVGVASATYNAAEHQVTLTLDKRLHRRQGIQVKIKGM